MCVAALLSDRHARRINRAQQKEIGADMVASVETIENLTTPDRAPTLLKLHRHREGAIGKGSNSSITRPDSRHDNSGPESAATGGHCLEANPGTVDNQQGAKQRQRSFKVCALFKVNPRKYTKYFCPECTIGNRRKYICNVVREGRQNTCFHIWHDD
ncbi:uncharacterized protein IUM83_16955 [Phytophthora cinnamomi]|uniref:uncharacterized protein n=1 Tax=Phytophthora cinnamomi TaxID=4785 RepID=UPI00355A4A82|nr:hypothetical protein IUM83_16955 [Phytophthora cinnamomi]